MDRRQFLRTLGSVIPATVAARAYFFAPIGGWHSDVIVSPHPYPGVWPDAFYGKGIVEIVRADQAREQRNQRIEELLRETFNGQPLPHITLSYLLK